jgi:hypothetical protein
VVHSRIRQQVLVKWVINFYIPKEVHNCLTNSVKRNFSCNIMKDGVGLFVVCKWNFYSSSLEMECKSPPLQPVLSHICKFQSSVLSKDKKILIGTFSYITAVFGGVLLVNIHLQNTVGCHSLQNFVFISYFHQPIWRSGAPYDLQELPYNL